MGAVEKRIDIKGTLDFTFDANWDQFAGLFLVNFTDTNCCIRCATAAALLFTVFILFNLLRELEYVSISYCISA